MAEISRGRLAGIHEEFEKEAEVFKQADENFKQKDWRESRKAPDFSDRTVAAPGYRRESSVGDNLVSFSRKTPDLVDFPTKEMPESFTKRFQEKQQEKKHARKMKIFKIATASVVIAGTIAGFVVGGPVGSFFADVTHDFINQPTMEQEQDNEIAMQNDQLLMNAYSEAGITPTEDELEAGLTPEQIIDKRIADEQYRQENQNIIGQNQSRGSR